MRSSVKLVGELHKRMDLIQKCLERSVMPQMVTPQPLPLTIPGRVNASGEYQKLDMEGTFPLSPFDRETPLPPFIETLALTEYFFENFNRLTPLFDKSSFLSRMKESSEQQPSSDPAWWAARNVVLAITHRLRAMETTLNFEEENQKAWGYLRNTSKVISELTLGEPSLLGVQSLLGISIFLQGTNNPRRASALVASSIRLCQYLGLHRQNTNAGFPSTEDKQRSRTFWIAYLLDKDYSIRLGQPPVQCDNYIELPLPEDSPIDSVGLIHALDRRSTFNFFRRSVELSVILGRIYSKLHSVQTPEQTEQQRSKATLDLDEMLDKWTQSIPDPFRPENMARNLPQGDIMHMVILYLSYFNCLSKLHLAAVDQSTWTAGKLSVNRFLRAERVISSREKVLQAARASVHLLDLTPQGNNACTW